MTTCSQLNGITTFYRAVGLSNGPMASAAVYSLPLTPCVVEALVPFTNAYHEISTDFRNAALWPNLMSKARTAIAENNNAHTTVPSDMAAFVTGLSPTNLRDVATLLRNSNRISYFHSPNEVLGMVRAALNAASPRDGDTSSNASSAPVGSVAPVDDTPPAQKQIRVLVVDDDLQVIKLVGRTIKQLGGIIVHAANTKQEINALLSGAIDLAGIDVAFIDYCLENSFSGTNSDEIPYGTDVIKKLREMGTIIPIYLSTSGWEDPLIRRKAEVVGATGVIDKVTKSQMSPDEIRRVLGLPSKD